MKMQEYLRRLFRWYFIQILGKLIGESRDYQLVKCINSSSENTEPIGLTP